MSASVATRDSRSLSELSSDAASRAVSLTSSSIALGAPPAIPRAPADLPFRGVRDEEFFQDFYIAKNNDAKNIADNNDTDIAFVLELEDNSDAKDDDEGLNGGKEDRKPSAKYSKE